MLSRQEREQLEQAHACDDGAAASSSAVPQCAAALAFVASMSAIGAYHTTTEDVLLRQGEMARLSVEEAGVVAARDLYRQRQLRVAYLRGGRTLEGQPVAFVR